ncbi:MAG: exosortase-associated EpsI family protein [Phycisphaerales bacterium]
MKKIVRNPAFLVTLLLLVAAASSMSAGIGYFKVYLRKAEIYPESGLKLLSLPPKTRTWLQVSQDQQVSVEIQEVLGTHNHVTRWYQKQTEQGNGQRVQLHAAYYTGMIDTVPHVPDRCFVGAGMEMTGEIGDMEMPLDTSRWREDASVPERYKGRIYTTYDSNRAPVRLPLDAKNTKLRVMRFRTPGSETPTFAGYFFVANGGTVSRAEDVRLLAFNLDDYYAYYLKVQFTCATVSDEHEFAALCADFLSEIYPDIMRCAPDWVRVEKGEYPPDNPRQQTIGGGG